MCVYGSTKSSRIDSKHSTSFSFQKWEFIIPTLWKIFKKLKIMSQGASNLTLYSPQVWVMVEHLLHLWILWLQILGLGLFYPPSKQLKKYGIQTHLGPLPDFSSCYPTNVDLVNGGISNPSSSCSCPNSWGQFDQRYFKTLFRALTERIDWQPEAISVISETIACCRLGNEKRHGASPKEDIWFNFVGPDRFNRKKIDVALAEILYGRRENFICVDLSF